MEGNYTYKESRVIKMEKREQLYEGKAKKVYKTDDPELYIVSYKDDATAFDGQKKGTIVGKGVVNNRMRLLEKAGVPTPYVQELNDRETVVKKVSIVPLEVIIRNISAGSFAKRYGVEEGIVFDAPTIEFSYKNDALHDPLINAYHARALKLATAGEIETIKSLAFKVNDTLKAYFLSLGVKLVDFKLELGVCPTAPSCLRMKYRPTPAVFGMRRRTKSSIRTASAVISAAWRMPTAK